MSIRVKLIVLIAILIFAFAAAVAVYFGARSPLGAIRAEQQKLTDLRFAIENETLQASKLAWSPFADQLKVFKDATAKTATALSDIKKLTVLPRLSKQINESLGNIQTLESALGSSTQSLLTSADKLLSDASGTKGLSPGFDLVHLPPFASSVLSDTDPLFTQMYMIASPLALSSSIIDSQTVLIAKEVARVESRSMLIAVLVIGILVLLSVAIALILANRIVRSIRSITTNVGAMKTGDLVGRFNVTTRDEIGSLSSDLNGFLGWLSDSIVTVQNASTENVNMKVTLTDATERSRTIAGTMRDDAEAIDNRMHTLGDNLALTDKAVVQIAENVTTLNEQISEQATMVEQSTASVTQMIASVDNVSRIAEERRKVTDRLVESVSEGEEKIGRTVGTVRQIQDSLDSIHGIVSIIRSISAQTNLLAMNAAIEAAHAGDAGRGFSVVADEIRKLAEASAHNSEEIRKILGAIIERITDAGSSGEQMQIAFHSISQEVRSVSESLQEIFSNMAELRSGSAQILEAMGSLRTVSTHVRDNSMSISANVKAIRGETETGSEIGSEVRASMEAMQRGAQGVLAAVGEVSSIADRLGSIAQTLNREMLRFRTADELRSE